MAKLSPKDKAVLAAVDAYCCLHNIPVTYDWNNAKQGVAMPVEKQTSRNRKQYGLVRFTADVEPEMSHKAEYEFIVPYQTAYSFAHALGFVGNPVPR
jgi:hypothetical protein